MLYSLVKRFPSAGWKVPIKYVFSVLRAFLGYSIHCFFFCLFICSLICHLFLCPCKSRIKWMYTSTGPPCTWGSSEPSKKSDNILNSCIVFTMSFAIVLLISIQHLSDRLFKWEEMSSHAWNCMLRMWAPLRAKSGHWAKYGSIVEKCSSALRQVSSFGEMGLFYISRAFQGSSSVSGMQQQPQQQCWAGPSKQSSSSSSSSKAEQSSASKAGWSVQQFSWLLVSFFIRQPFWWAAYIF